MADDPAPRFCGKYVLSTFQLGWLTTGSGGNLAFVTDAFPLDGSGFFNCYALANGAVVLQAAVTRQYLALAPDGATVVANAATPAAALQLGLVLTFNQFNQAQWVGKTREGYISATGEPSPALQFGFNPPSSLSLMCVVPGAPIPLMPSPPAARLGGDATEPDPTRVHALAAAATATRQSARKPVTAVPATSRDASAPPFPYFCGKYSLELYEAGWVFGSSDNGVGVTPGAFPTDGSGLFICYSQPPITVGSYGTLPAMSWQTTPGPGQFLAMPAAGQTAIAINPDVPTVAQATAFANMLPQPGEVVGWSAILCSTPSPILGWYGEMSRLVDNPTVRVSDGTNDNWDMALATRLVAGLQDVLAPGAQNWWDGADLSYVDMTTCVGSLNGAAAQWGNANFTGAVLAKMDLTAITIGNAVNFTSASLAGVTFKAGQDLSNAILKDADLSRVDLSAVKVPADFTGTNLTNAILEGVDLSRATCVGTNFSGCDLITTKLPTAPGALGQGSSGAIFAGATVRITSADTMIHGDSLGSDWRNLNLSAAKLVPLPAIVIGLKADYANLERTILDEMTFIKDAGNNGASFQGADLTGASLRGVSAEGANFSSAILYAANLSKADLSSTTWSNAFAGTRQQLFSLSPFDPTDTKTLNGGGVPDDLSKAFASNGHPLQNPQVKVRSNSSAWLITDGSGAYSVVASPNALDVLIAGQTSAQFADAYMENANLTGGSFTGVHFGGVQLINAADASGVDFEQANFSGANISSATPNQPNLAGAYLYGAILRCAFLFNADLSGAYLSPSSGPTGADLSGAMLAGATLTGAQLDGAIMTGAFVALNPQGAPTSFCGVPLFTLDANKFPPILNDGANWGTSAPAALQNAFQTNGISLSGPAFFTAYPGQLQWGISLTDADYDPPPPPPTAGWVWTAFMIMQGNSQYQGTDALVVYGTMLWMFAPDVTGALQPEPYGVAPTALVQTDIAETTFCPNSNTWATNAANGIPWEAAMMPVPQSFRDRS